MWPCNKETVKVALSLASLLFLVTTASSLENTGNQNLLGAWRYNKDNLSADALKKERVFTVFTFNADNTIDVMDFLLDGIGPGMGEGLGSTGRYRLQGSRLVIRSGPDPENGWPVGGYKGHRITYSCRIEFMPDGLELHLSRCAIAGTWYRLDKRDH